MRMRLKRMTAQEHSERKAMTVRMSAAFFGSSLQFVGSRMEVLSG
jgi:hypothetical protein